MLEMDSLTRGDGTAFNAPQLDFVEDAIKTASLYTDSEALLRVCVGLLAKLARQDEAFRFRDVVVQFFVQHPDIDWRMLEQLRNESGWEQLSWSGVDQLDFYLNEDKVKPAFSVVWQVWDQSLDEHGRTDDLGEGSWAMNQLYAIPAAVAELYLEKHPDLRALGRSLFDSQGNPVGHGFVTDEPNAMHAAGFFMDMAKKALAH